MKHLFLILVLLLSSQVARSGPIGVEVQSANYDPIKGITTIQIVNTSPKEISAINLSIRVTFPDGTITPLGANEFRIEFLEGIIQGKGGFAPGAYHTQEFSGQAGPVQATVDMVAYSDGTADVLNERAFKRLISDRKARARATQKVNELLNQALADPAAEHPSATVAAQLRSLVAAIRQQTITEEGAANYASVLQSAIQNLDNATRFSSVAQNNSLRALIDGNNQHIPILIRHSALVKAVQP
jgi:hypothetical protein